jgi:hypothetical protein
MLYAGLRYGNGYTIRLILFHRSGHLLRNEQFATAIATPKSMFMATEVEAFVDCGLE